MLVELADDYDLPAVIIDYRSVSKLKSTYTDKLPLQIDKATGRIHTSYHQAVAATGRLSSTDPNLQNIPIRTPEGRRIRQAFIAPAGPAAARGRLFADRTYGSWRIFRPTPASCRHSRTSRTSTGRPRPRSSGCSLADVTDDQRRSAKAINFGLMYGMSAFGLAKQLGISRGEAQEYVNLYFDRYPGVKAFMDTIRETASKDGFVETVFGRRLYLPEINDRNANRRQYAERTAINAPMQGTAADIIKRAMISVHGWLKEEQPGARMIMQVHDELVFEVDKDKVDAVSEHVVELMCAAATLEVPLKVDVGVGMNWDEAH